MSPRLASLTGAAALVAAAFIWWLAPDRDPAEPDAGPDPARLQTADRAPRTPPARPPSRFDALPAPVLSPHPAGSREHADWVEERMDALGKLSWMEDEGSLMSILAELGNPEPELRQAALNASLNYGSRDAIPYFQEAADRCQDPEEKLRLTKAVDYLKLPSLTEYLAKQREKANAR